MDKQLEDLKRRTSELERLMWAMFRALETYITFNDLPSADGTPADHGDE